MIAVSTVVMFVLMYLNTYALDHVFHSQTRSWMAIVMGAAMAVVMIGFMWSMHRNRTAHIAIMTSERAHIRDPRVRDLADRIIEAQLREIDKMKALIADLDRTPPPGDAPDLPSYRQRGASPPPPK